MHLFRHILFVFSILTLWACGNNPISNSSAEAESQTPHIKIGISKAKGSTGYLRYGKWIKKLDSTVQYFDLYHTTLDSALMLLESCDALLVSGGPDVSPDLYNQIQDTVLCEPSDFRRDSLEFALIQYAVSHKMPILGICRGEQILNVYFGGSLYPDIPTAIPNNVGHRFAHIDSSHHNITVSEGLLFEITKSKTGTVNSSHHQAINRLSDSLKVFARTDDGIVESIGWKKPEGKGFLLGVQWHPEWLSLDNPFSSNIGYRFINEAQSFHQSKLK